MCSCIHIFSSMIHHRIALGRTGMEQMGVQLAELELMLLLVVGSGLWLGPSVPKQV